MFYFRLILTSLLAIASLSSLIGIFLTKKSNMLKIILAASVIIFAIVIYIINLRLTIPEIYITQEYPTHTRSYKDHIDLRNESAVLKYSQEFQNFWIGLWNNNKNETYINPIIFIHFIDKVDIDSEETKKKGWQETEPNEDYNYRFIGDLHAGDGFRAESLRIRFDKRNKYRAVCSINVRDKQKIEIPFIINVK